MKNKTDFEIEENSNGIKNSTNEYINSKESQIVFIYMIIKKNIIIY